MTSGAPTSADDRSGPELVYTLGSSRRIKLRNVEAELTALWEEASRQAERAGQDGVLRLREINLVAYAAGDEVAERVSQVIARLAHRHPARAIILLDVGLDAPGGGATDAWVSAACYLTPRGERHVCWEQVTIPAWGRAAHLLDTTALPVLVPHLPTVLWWPGRPDLSGDIFRRLGEVTDLLVVDSAEFDDPLTGLAELATVAAERSRNYHMNDLNWGRLTPWREMVAEAFDDPERLALLSRLAEVRVVYGPEDVHGGAERVSGPAAARALLLAGWLAARLGLQPASRNWETTPAGALRVLLSSGAPGGRPVEVTLESRALPGSVAGGLVEVELALGGPEELVTVSVGRIGETCLCETRVTGAGTAAVGRTVDAAAVPEDRLLAEELDYLGPDRVYEEALAVAASLARLPGADRLASSP